MRIAVPIIAQTIDEARRDMDLAEKQGADIIELRFDYIDNPEIEDIETLVKHNSVPKIYTNRHSSQSGPDKRAGFKDSEQKRLEFGQAALGAGVNYYDVEQGHELNFKPENPNKQRSILSYHNFLKTPSLGGLQRQFKSMLEDSAGAIPYIIKIATMANDYRDSLNMLKFLEWKLEEYGPGEGEIPQLIGLCMGKEGIPTRVLGSAYGSYMTFASLERGKSSAPGQMTLSELREAYKLLQID